MYEKFLQILDWVSQVEEHQRIIITNLSGADSLMLSGKNENDSFYLLDKQIIDIIHKMFTFSAYDKQKAEAFDNGYYEGMFIYYSDERMITDFLSDFNIVVRLYMIEDVLSSL